MKRTAEKSIIELGMRIFVSVAMVLCPLAIPVQAKESIKFVQEINNSLEEPVDVAVSEEGKIYILDRKLSKVLIFDGKGDLALDFGDKGYEKGQFVKPQSIALTKNHEIIVADTGNSRVQVFNDQGHFLYMLGDLGNRLGQFSAPRSVAVDQMGNIYVGDVVNKTISKFSPKGVLLEVKEVDYKPMDMMFDLAQNMYVLTPESGKIIKYAADSQLTKEVIYQADGKNYMSQAQSLAVDHRGDLYLIETLEHTIRKIDDNAGLLFAFGSRGNGRGQFEQPSGIFADGNNKLYVSDILNKRVQIFEISGSDKSPIQAAAYKPPVIDFDSSIKAEASIVDLQMLPEKGLYALSDLNNYVLHKSIDGAIFERFKNSSEKLNAPKALHVRSDGMIYVADTGNSRVQFLKPNGVHDYHFGTRGNKTSQFNNLQGVVTDKEGFIYVADTANNRIQVFNSDGIYLKTLINNMVKVNQSGNAMVIKLEQPTSLAFDSQERLHVLDTRNKRVLIFDKNANYIKEIGGILDNELGLRDPVDIGIDENDYLYIADRGSFTVKIVNPKGMFVKEFGSFGQGPSYFPQLSAVAASKGKIYVADYKIGQIRVFNFNPDQNMNENREVAKKQSVIKEPSKIEEVKKEEPKMEVKKDMAKKEEAPMVINELLSEDVKYTAYLDQGRLFIVTYALPLNHIMLSDNKQKDKVDAAMLMLAKQKIISKFGLTEEMLVEMMKIENQEMAEDGQIKLTVSVPGDLLMKQQQQRDQISKK